MENKIEFYTSKFLIFVEPREMRSRGIGAGKTLTVLGHLHVLAHDIMTSLLPSQGQRYFVMRKISLIALVSYLLYSSIISKEWTRHQQPSGADFLLTVYALLYKRPQGARALLEDLGSAEYKGYKIPLRIVIEHDPDRSAENQEVVKIARKFRWEHGPSSVYVQPKKKGLAKSWLSLGTGCSEGSLLAVFEDDLRLSPYWFQWTLDIYEKYLSPTQRSLSEVSSNIIGLSLTPIRVKEMKYPYEPWDSTRKLNMSHSVFLHNLPSSWAPVMVCKEWQNFLPYAWYRRNKVFLPNETADPIAGAHLGDPNFNLPSCFSNMWNQSWKRLLMEYCFILGKTTIYPNILGQAGLATNLHLPGTHVSSAKSTRVKLDHRTNHLILDDSIFVHGFPPVDNMVVFDVHSNKASHAILRQQGSVLEQGLLRLGSIYTKGIEFLRSSSSIPDVPNKDWYFVCPEGSLHKQWTRQLLLLHSIWGGGEGFLLSHMKVLVPGYGYQYIPYSEIFDVTHKIGFTHVKIATVANLAQARPAWLFSDIGNISLHACKSYYLIWSDSGNSRKHIPIQSIRQVERQSNVSRWIGFSPDLVDATEKVSSASQKIDGLLHPNFRTELYMSEMIQKKSLLHPDFRLCVEYNKCATGSCQERVHSLLSGLINHTLNEAVLIGDNASTTELIQYISAALHISHVITPLYIQQHLEKRAPLQPPGLRHATSAFLQFSFCASSRVLVLREQGDLWHLMMTIGLDSSQHLISF
mmetsp:Transcript_3597/g.7328  ORF Transcript_3597/g.7328 Transcript_3597/m.7328 type:complete len:748 (+) Transcript_3597:5551-7794(+)